MDFAGDYEVDSKAYLEWFSDLLHTHLEMAMIDYANDEGGIEDYEHQY